jgi:3-dehydroquinate dehydratase-2
MKNILILNGPNLNLLGIRQMDIYGDKLLDEIIAELQSTFTGHNIVHRQSNHEGVLIDLLHEYGFSYDGIVLNAGAYTHTSLALADAVRSITSPVIELHISDIYKREPFRAHSYLKDVCLSQIVGKGTEGYAIAVAQFLGQGH